MKRCREQARRLFGRFPGKPVYRWGPPHRAADALYTARYIRKLEVAIRFGFEPRLTKLSRVAFNRGWSKRRRELGV